MARPPRIVIPGQPLHLVQRGINRSASFFAETDYEFYRDALRQASWRFGCAIHAYVLMSNHVHLLITPEGEHGPARMMQAVGRRYVRYINAHYRRTGTLWEGRYKSSLIDSERYLLACSRYIELNPVRAGVANDPAHYRWSSHRRNAAGDTDPLVTPHEHYRALGMQPTDQQSAYRKLFDTPLEPQALDAIRDSLNIGSVLGNERFREQIEAVLHRRVTRFPHGGDRRSEAFQAMQDD